MRTLVQRVLQHAAETVGSLERRAVVLEISSEDLRGYLAGTKAVPDLTVLRAADLVIEDLDKLRRVDPSDDPEILRGR